MCPVQRAFETFHPIPLLIPEGLRAGGLKVFRSASGQLGGVVQMYVFTYVLDELLE